MSKVLVVVSVLGTNYLPLACSTSLHPIIMPSDAEAAPIIGDSTTAPLPLLPPAFSKEAFNLGASSVVNLWEHGIRVQNKGRVRVGISSAAEPPAPQTVVAPQSRSMENLVPQDASHPLYHAGPAYTALRHAFLLDSFVPEEVDPQNEAMTTAAGLTINNMNGKTLVFKRDQKGFLSVNNIPVLKQQRLSDGTQLYVVEKLLFTHETDVRQAFSRLMAEDARSGVSHCFDC